MPSLAPSERFFNTIQTQNEAIRYGMYDAYAGRSCDPDAYQYPNDARQKYLRSDYVYSYIKAKGA